MEFKKTLLASLIFSALMEPASAALMRDDISTQVYRDFGENRGILPQAQLIFPFITQMVL